MRIWSMLLIESDWKWCIHLRRSLFLNFNYTLRKYQLQVAPGSQPSYIRFTYHIWCMGDLDPKCYVFSVFTLLNKYDMKNVYCTGAIYVITCHRLKANQNCSHFMCHVLLYEISLYRMTKCMLFCDWVAVWQQQNKTISFIKWSGISPSFARLWLAETAFTRVYLRVNWPLTAFSGLFGVSIFSQRSIRGFYF